MSSICHQLGLRVGEEVNEGKLVEGMEKIIFFYFTKGGLAELGRGMLSTNRGNLLGWRKGEKMKKAERIRNAKTYLLAFG